MKTIAFIFARGGSKRLKNKNVKLLNNKPLIYYSIKIAQELKMVSDIYVSSDDINILKISKSYGANIIKRPKYLSKSNSNEILAWKHAVKHILKKGINFDNFLSLPTTSPLRTKKDIYNVFEKLDQNTDIVLTATDTHRNPWKNMIYIKNNKPFLINKIKLNKKVPKIFDLTTVAYLAKTDYVLSCTDIFDGNVKVCFIPRSRALDIDDDYDFDIAKKFLNK